MTASPLPERQALALGRDGGERRQSGRLGLPPGRWAPGQLGKCLWPLLLPPPEPRLQAFRGPERSFVFRGMCPLESPDPRSGRSRRWRGCAGGALLSPLRVWSALTPRSPGAGDSRASVVVQGPRLTGPQTQCPRLSPAGSFSGSSGAAAVAGCPCPSGGLRGRPIGEFKADPPDLLHWLNGRCPIHELVEPEGA